MDQNKQPLRDWRYLWEEIKTDLLNGVCSPTLVLACTVSMIFPIVVTVTGFKAESDFGPLFTLCLTSSAVVFSDWFLINGSQNRERTWKSRTLLHFLLLLVTAIAAFDYSRCPLLYLAFSLPLAFLLWILVKSTDPSLMQGAARQPHTLQRF